MPGEEGKTAETFKKSHLPCAITSTCFQRLCIVMHTPCGVSLVGGVKRNASAAPGSFGWGGKGKSPPASSIQGCFRASRGVSEHPGVFQSIPGCLGASRGVPVHPGLCRSILSVPPAPLRQRCRNCSRHHWGRSPLLSSPHSTHGGHHPLPQRPSPTRTPMSPQVPKARSPSPGRACPQPHTAPRSRTPLTHSTPPAPHGVPQDPPAPHRAPPARGSHLSLWLSPLSLSPPPPGSEWPRALARPGRPAQAQATPCSRLIGCFACQSQTPPSHWLRRRGYANQRAVPALGSAVARVAAAGPGGSGDRGQGTEGQGTGDSPAPGSAPRCLTPCPARGGSAPSSSARTPWPHAVLPGLSPSPRLHATPARTPQPWRCPGGALPTPQG